MIELHVLGTLELTGSGGRELRDVLRQPKRVALLAYLALHQPHGFHRRDTLLGLFWPELDRERAGRSLRGALHFLRRALGEDVIVARGGELGVDRSRLWCDAVAFEQAIERGEPHAALDLYRGDLLEGFFITGAPEFERWLEHERARLRGRAFGAAGQLSDRHEAEGDAVAALDWARRASALSPYDERAARRVMELLARLGDRASAVAAYDAFARRLAADLEVQPSAETRALVAALRAEASAREPWRATAAPDVPSPEAAGADTRDSPVAPLRGRAGRRPRLWHALSTVAGRGAVAAGLLVALSVGGWLVWRRADQTEPPGGPTRIAVLPFSVRGDEGFAYLGEGMVDLLSARLDGAGNLRALPPRTVLAAVGPGLPRSADAAAPRALAERLGATVYVTGSILALERQLHIRAAIEPVRGPAPAIAQATVAGEPETLFQLVDELATRLIVGAVDVGATALRRDRLATRSVAALQAYLVGESALRAGRFAEAVEAFERAVAEDSTFALAQYRLAVALVWATRPQPALEAAERALRHADALGDQDQLLLRGLVAWRRGAADEAEYIYRAAVNTYPENTEAWHQLGETLIHYNPLRGRPIGDARSAFERVLLLDPASWGALWHLAQIEATERRWAAFDSIMDRLLASAPEAGRVLEIRLMQASARGDTAERQRLERELQLAEKDRVYTIVWRLGVYLHDLDGAAAVTGVLTQPSRPPTARAGGFLRRAHLELARGRARAADVALEAMATLDPLTAAEQRALFAALPFLPTPPSSLAALRRRLAGLDVAAAGSATEVEHHSLLRMYLLGVLSARLGEPATARLWARTLEQPPQQGTDSALARDLALAVHGHADRAAGRTEDALRAFERIRLERWYEEAVTGAVFGSQSYDRWTRAELLEELGREDEALRWYRTFGEHSVFDLVFLAPSHLRRARIYERAGQPDRAAEHYARFIALWQDCDPELRPMLEEARRGLTALQRPPARP